MMEIQEKEKIVIAKPIACRPHFSNLKSFPELFSGSISASPPAAHSESAVAVIKPRTVRFKSAGNNDFAGAEECPSAACHPPRRAPEANVTCSVVYKPIAKLVSKTTVSLLANLGSHGIIPAREIAEVGSVTQPSNQVNHQTEETPEFCHDFPPQSEQKANTVLENSEDDNKSLLLANSGDRLSYDGHNWRKYGQKQVKGSEYPRSYYKCTYPNCPVKKKVEKTLDGQIAEIVYKGEHNHSKPQPLNHTPSGGHAQRPAYDATPKEVKDHLTNQDAETVRGHEVRSENQDITGSSLQPTYSGAPPVNYPIMAAACNAGPSTSNNSVGLSGECEEVSEFLEAEADDFRSKRTKREDQLLKASTVREASSEPQIIVQNKTDSGITGDGFRWRKYGQKVVKGKIYPRSYYRCTNPKCNVRKYVERTSEDPATFITTYEGRHNHPMPVKSTNAEASKTSTKTKL